MSYLVTVNTAGYLPEQDPYEVSDLTTARQIVADEIERDWDSEYEVAESDEDRLDIDGRYLDAHTGAALMSADDYVLVTGPGSHALDRIYSIITAGDES